MLLLKSGPAFFDFLVIIQLIMNSKQNPELELIKALKWGLTTKSFQSGNGGTGDPPLWGIYRVVFIFACLFWQCENLKMQYFLSLWPSHCEGEMEIFPCNYHLMTCPWRCDVFFLHSDLEQWGEKQINNLFVLLLTPL